MTDPRLDGVLAEVRTLVPLDERERLSIERVLVEAPLLEAPFDEHASLVHLTGSAFVVGVRGTVLHRHRVLGIWIQPGGHVEAGEEVWQGAQREVEEETGLMVSQPPEGPLLLHVDVHPGPRGHTHFDLRYVLLGATQHPSPPPEESQEVRWCSFVEAQQLADTSLVPVLQLLEETWHSHEPAWRAMVDQMDRRNQPGS